MRTIILFITMLFLQNMTYSQEVAVIEGNEVPLIKAAEGEIDLLWCLYLRQTKFYVKTKEGTLIELNKTNDPNFKSQLSQLTNGFGNPSDLKFKLHSLSDYINNYNASIDPDFKAYESPNKLKWQMAAMGGVSNNPFVTNNDNVLNAMLGLELEVSGNVPTSKHSGFLQLRQVFKNDSFEYQTTELSLGYRYRFIRKENFNVFAQTKFATLNFSEATILNVENDEIMIKDTAFDIPFIIGLGTDIRLGKHSYLTFIYGELFAVFVDNQGNFPLDFSVGYRFEL